MIASGYKLERWHPHRGELRRLLVSIAYDPIHFERAVDLLAILGRTESSEQRQYESVRDKILPMFRIQRSGTHATPEQRFAVIDKWLGSGDPQRRALGLEALNAALETRFSGADPQVEFGAERRNSGWWPKTRTELRDWFVVALDRARALLSDPDRHENGRSLIAKHYPALAGYTEVVPAAVRAMQDAAGGTFWPRGWFAACDAVWRLRKRKRPRPVTALERAMRPATLADEIEVWLRLEWHDWRNPEHADQSRDDWPEAHRRALTAAQRAIDDDVLVQRVLENPAYEGRYLGQGLAEAGASDLQQGWDRLRRLLGKIVAEKPNWAVFAGYLGVVRKQAPDLADALLDAAMADLALRPFAIILCVTDGDTNDRGLSRILSLLRDPRTPPEERRAVYAIQLDESVSMVRTAELINALVEAHEVEQALHLLGHRDQEGEWELPLRLAGRKALLQAELARPDDVNGYWDRRSSKIAERSLAGPDGADTAAALLSRIMELGNDRRGWGRGMPVKLMKVLVRLHPKLALDTLLPALLDERHHVLRSLLTEHDDDDRPTSNAFNGVPDDIMRTWLNEDPVIRGPVLATWGLISPRVPRVCLNGRRWLSHFWTSQQTIRSKHSETGSNPAAQVENGARGSYVVARWCRLCKPILTPAYVRGLRTCSSTSTRGSRIARNGTVSL